MARIIKAGCCAAIVVLLSAPVTAQGIEPGQAKAVPHVRVADSVARWVVLSGILGAAARLRRPNCQRILTDFQDESGASLLANLAALPSTADAYVVERVWFVDGSDTPQCRKDQTLAAFTAAGSKVVWICAARFAQRFSGEITAAEVLIIHEVLHTLGLGEDPPSSAEITRQVIKRCGGS